MKSDPLVKFYSSVLAYPESEPVILLYEWEPKPDEIPDEEKRLQRRDEEERLQREIAAVVRRVNGCQVEIQQRRFLFLLLQEAAELGLVGEDRDHAAAMKRVDLIKRDIRKIESEMFERDVARNLTRLCALTATVYLLGALIYLAAGNVDHNGPVLLVFSCFFFMTSGVGIGASFFYALRVRFKGKIMRPSGSSLHPRDGIMLFSTTDLYPGLAAAWSLGLFLITLNVDFEWGVLSKPWADVVLGIGLLLAWLLVLQGKPEHE